MKIRIKGNTLRYRLSKTEVETLAVSGMLEEHTEFPNGTLKYSIRQTNKDRMFADFSNNNIILYVPKLLLQEWTTTERVGLNEQANFPNGNVLQLLLEKDFKCIDADIKEDQSDYFENPHSTC